MEQIKRYFLPLILLLGFVLRLVNLNQSFWLDEAAQVIESARSLSQQLSIAGDFQPPLFHLLLHFWMYLGKSEAWIRLLPVFISLITLYVSYLFGKKIVNRDFGLTLSFFLAISPFHIYYSQEVRPYALSALLGIVSTYFLFEKKIFWYFVSCVLFLYSIYLAPFLIIAHGIWVLIFQRKFFKKFLFSVFGIIIAFMPWFPSFIKQLQIGTGLTAVLPGWSQAVSSPVLKSLPLIFTKFLLGRVTIDQKILYGGIVISLFLGFLLLLLFAFKNKHKSTVQLFLLFIVPIILIFVVSFFVPVLAPKRVLFSLPFFFGLLSIGIFSLSKKVKLALISIVVLISSVSLFSYYTNSRFQREKWREAVSYVEKNADPESLVIFVFPNSFAPWQWYSNGSVDTIGVAPNFVLQQDDIDKIAPVIISRNRIFLFQYLTDLTDPEDKMKALLQELGFVEIKVKDFPGVGFVYIYEKFIAHN